MNVDFFLTKNRNESSTLGQISQLTTTCKKMSYTTRYESLVFSLICLINSGSALVNQTALTFVTIVVQYTIGILVIRKRLRLKARMK
jgi:hypothetical protein